MQHSEAKALVATLLAAFRPRDWGEASDALYTTALTEHDFADGQAAVRALIRHTDFFPSLHGLVEEILEQRSHRPGRALPAPAWTDADEDAAKEATERWYAEHPFVQPPKTVPQTRVIEVDEADVERRRRAARKAARKLKAEERAERAAARSGGASGTEA